MASFKTLKADWAFGFKALETSGVTSGMYSTFAELSTQTLPLIYMGYFSSPSCSDV